MAAWNYPFNLLMGPAIQAIAAGNCVLLKPSELAPNTAVVIEKLCDKYLDKRFVQCVNGAANVCIKLTSMRFDKIIFTGSTQKGKLVAKAAG